VAELRKSAKQSAARDRAREKAAQFRQREDTLESLAVDYFTSIEQVEKVNAAAEKEIARIREQAARNIAQREKSAAVAVVAMLSTGASRAEVSARLGLTVKEVRRAADLISPPTAANEEASTPSISE
jgi:hypothetical protein